MKINEIILEGRGISVCVNHERLGTEISLLIKDDREMVSCIEMDRQLEVKSIEELSFGDYDDLRIIDISAEGIMQLHGRKGKRWYQLEKNGHRINKKDTDPKDFVKDLPQVEGIKIRAAKKTDDNQWWVVGLRYNIDDESIVEQVVVKLDVDLSIIVEYSIHQYSEYAYIDITDISLDKTFVYLSGYRMDNELAKPHVYFAMFFDNL